MTHQDARLRRFGTNSLAFIANQLGVDWACYYRVDDNNRPFGFSALGVPEGLRRAYLDQNMDATDPLHPARLGTSGARYASLLDPCLPLVEHQRQRYWHFLRGFGARDSAEMFFRSKDAIVGGISLVWTQKAVSRAETKRALQIQSYVESSLDLLLHACEEPDDAPLEADARLTPREREIVDLTCQGCTNRQIASALDVGVSTVKTHLIHIFEKLRVRNRAMLVRQAMCK
jgi:DNA-binding CsgD family transcriptional regulator